VFTVHHLEKSRSTRILWLLEELGVPYEVKRYARNPKTMLAPPELKAIHPLGKAPVVTDDGKVLAESAIILDYILDTYGKGRFRPEAGTDERRRYDYWMHYAEGSAMPPLLLKLIFGTVKRKAPWPIKPIAKAIANQVLSSFVDPALKTHFDWVESELGKSTWFVGDELTAADMQMSYPVEAALVRADGARPKMAAWLERVHARPAYKKAIEVGGPVLPS